MDGSDGCAVGKVVCGDVKVNARRSNFDISALRVRCLCDLMPAI
jgi:hypothetical protein